LVELFQTTKQNISLHIRNIFTERELHEGSVVKEYLTTAADGKSYLFNANRLHDEAAAEALADDEAFKKLEEAEQALPKPGKRNG
jgi:hypothetical protein